MPRYYLNLYNRIGPVPDWEGQVLADSAAARQRAVESIREMVSADALEGVLHLRGRIEVLDEQRQLLSTTTFMEVFDLTLGAPFDA